VLDFFGDCWRVFESAEEHWIFSESVGERSRVLESAGFFRRVFETVGECWRVLESVEDCWIFSEFFFFFFQGVIGFTPAEVGAAKSASASKN